MSDIVPFRPRNKQLAGFIDACLEPLPESALIDTHYNSLVRHSRRENWMKAKHTLEFYRAYLDMIDALGVYYRPSLKLVPKDLADRATVTACYKQAKADLLRTPVMYKSDIAWKRRQDVRYVPTTQEEVNASIAADEAFLAAHPTTRKRASGGQS